MVEATSCGGVVIFRGKILLLYKNYKNKYEGWVLPKGTVEEGEDHTETALREVREETGVDASIIKYIGNKEGYIEGGSIAEIHDISIIKGTVIVKRTGVFKCFIRTIKRDYHNEYFMNEEIKKHGKFIAKFTRLHKVIKRRKKIFKTYHNIEDFINRLEKYR